MLILLYALFCKMCQPDEFICRTDILQNSSLGAAADGMNSQNHYSTIVLHKGGGRQLIILLLANVMILCYGAGLAHVSMLGDNEKLHVQMSR